MVKTGDIIELENGKKGMVTWIIDYMDRYLICYRDEHNKTDSFFEGDYDFKVL